MNNQCDWNGGDSLRGSALSSPALQALLNEIDVGVLLCTEDGSLAWANAAGHQELRQGGLLTLHPASAELHCGPSEAKRLRQAIWSAAQGKRHLLAFRADGERLMISLQPLVDSSLQERYALLLLGRRSMAPDLVVEMLCRLHALTAAEQRVLSGLLEGECVESLAQHHGVKVSTVRTQVAALRGKLGVKRIVDAMRLASELPPMASALRRSSPHSTGMLGWAAD